VVAPAGYAARVDQLGESTPPPDVIASPPPWRPPRGAVLFAAGVAVGVLLSSTAWVVVDRLHRAKPVAVAQATPSVHPTPPDGQCRWTPQAGAGERSVGLPPASAVPRAGTATMTITTNLGVIEIAIDRAKTPCAAASFAHLAGHQFFDGNACHRLTTVGVFLLQCGDPSGTGNGGPGYRFPDEAAPVWQVPPGLPTALPTALPSGPIWVRPGPESSTGLVPCTDMTIPPDLLPSGERIIIRCGGLVPRGELPLSYPRGTVALAHGGEPDGNGSQFFVTYRDSPLPPIYSLVGTVTKGMEIIDQVAAGGVAAGTAGGDGPPKIRLEINSLTVR
jgi:peptidyl-prolyl cis-trans isomerase B (cyclophilin B)